VEHAVHLFAELDDPTSREIRGLWGELLVILVAPDSSVLVRRWHDDPEDRFDFTAGAFALEVKTCKDLERIHVFSLSQLRPISEEEVLIASVPVRSDPAGETVLDLLSEIETRVPQIELRIRLRETAFRIGGSAIADSPHRFDRRAAAAGLRLIRATLIPAFENHPAAEILAVQLSIRCRDISGEDLWDWVASRMNG
jgi:hypothetical protein